MRWVSVLRAQLQCFKWQFSPEGAAALIKHEAIVHLIVCLVAYHWSQRNVSLSGLLFIFFIKNIKFCFKLEKYIPHEWTGRDILFYSHGTVILHKNYGMPFQMHPDAENN